MADENFKDEMLSDEELDNVAGGTAQEPGNTLTDEEIKRALEKLRTQQSIPLEGTPSETLRIPGETEILKDSSGRTFVKPASLEELKNLLPK